MLDNSWKDHVKQALRMNIKQYTMLGALFVIWLVFGILTDGVFLSTRNVSNLFVQTATTAILAMGMVLIIVAGHIDLSVGSTMGFCGALAVLIMLRFDVGLPVIVIGTLAVGMLIGAWHGYWVAYRRVPAFIVTLASMLAFRGAIIGVTGGQTLGFEMTADQSVAEHFKELGQGYLPSFNPNWQVGQWHDSSVLFGLVCTIFAVFGQWRSRLVRQRNGLDSLPLGLEIAKSMFVALAFGGFFGVMSRYLGVPYSIVLVLVFAWFLSLIMDRSVFGRHLYAIGGNAEAARFSGIDIRQRTLLAYVVMGFLVGLAGLISTARLNAATTSAGQNAELDAIASAVIGGTSLMGGEGTIWGAIIGALVMTSLDNGMSLLNMDITYQYVIKGGILLLAVWVDMARRK